ncbi:unnamed protein product [Cochlearia groenlandica]
MAKPNTQDFASKRHNSFHWTRKVGSDENDDVSSHNPSLDNTKPVPKHNPSSSSSSNANTPKRKLQSFAVSRLRSVIATLSRARPGNSSGLGSRVVGTLFGSRRGHVHFSIQKDPTSPPAFLIELATPISGLVKEMASGLVRIALECDKGKEEEGERREIGNLRRHGGGGEKAKVTIPRRLVEEPMWRTYCNGKKCGFATRRDCGEKENKVLKALEMVSMGAGVLPETEETSDGGGGGGDIMYMRAKFERIVGSRDSEAFYMMNPDSNGAPELSIYLLRI